MFIYFSNTPAYFDADIISIKWINMGFEKGLFKYFSLKGTQ
jgi:hypothetical protein